MNALVIEELDDGHLCVLRPEGRRIRVVQQGRLVIHDPDGKLQLLSRLLLRLQLLADSDQDFRV
ncbi:hypothetical protein D3C76_1774170 [compost metagenome]